MQEKNRINNEAIKVEFVDGENNDIFTTDLKEKQFLNDTQPPANNSSELQHLLDARQDEWQTKLRQLNSLSQNEMKERAFLVEQIRRHEDRNAVLTKQFNELYGYCESLYQDAEGRRKEAEARTQEMKDQVVILERGLTKKSEETSEIKEKFEASEERIQEFMNENTKLQKQVLELSDALEKQRNQGTVSLSSLNRGKQFIDSAVRSMADFQSSFQSYLNALDKDGLTPISIRTGKIFAESWKIQSEDLLKTSEILAKLMD